MSLPSLITERPDTCIYAWNSYVTKQTATSYLCSRGVWYKSWLVKFPYFFLSLLPNTSRRTQGTRIMGGS